MVTVMVGGKELGCRTRRFPVAYVFYSRKGCNTALMCVLASRLLEARQKAD